MQQNQDIVVHAVLDEYSEETITHQYRSLKIITWNLQDVFEIMLPLDLLDRLFFSFFPP